MFGPQLGGEGVVEMVINGRQSICLGLGSWVQMELDILDWSILGEPVPFLARLKIQFTVPRFPLYKARCRYNLMLMLSKPVSSYRVG